MRKLKQIIFFTILMIGSTAFAYEANQYMPDQIPENKGIQSGRTDHTSYLPSGVNDYLETMSTVNPSTYNLPVEPEDKLGNKEVRQDWKNHQDPQGTYDNSKELMSFSKNERFKSYYNQGVKSIDISYHRFDYTSNSSSYKNTFHSGKSLELGYLMIHVDSYIYRGKMFELSCLLGGGIGYQSGKGYFAGGNEESLTTFKLWTIPLDAHIGAGVPLSSFAKIYASGGPTSMILFQDRDDYDDDESGKYLTQVGVGFAVRSSLQLSLSRIFKESAHKMFRAYNVTNSFLNIEMRYDNMSQFLQKDISIVGTSVGVGFSFEYL